jgi:hypothetical protein
MQALRLRFRGKHPAQGFFSLGEAGSRFCASMSGESGRKT